MGGAHGGTGGGGGAGLPPTQGGTPGTDANAGMPNREPPFASPEAGIPGKNAGNLNE